MTRRLRLALASVVNDKPQQGTIQVATTEVSDAAAFARTQAGAYDPSAARTEAYARNNGGRFAESAEFFENLTDREGNDAASRAEALANQGLQQSNLSNFAAAERLLSAGRPRLAQGQWRHPAPAAQLSRDQPAQPA